MAVALISSLQGGGAERQVALLVKQGVFDYVLTLETDIDYVGLDMSKVYHLSKHRNDTHFIFKYLSIPIYAWRLKRFCKQYNQKIVVSFLFRPQLTSIMARLFFKHRNYISVRNNPFEHYKGGLKRLQFLLFRTFFWWFSTGFLVNSLEVVGLLRNRFGWPEKKLPFIPNGVDVDQVLTLAKQGIPMEYESYFQQPVVLALGRLCYQKGFIELIDCFKEVVQKVPEAKLLILGKGPWQQKIEQKIQELDLTETVHLLGFQKNPYPFIQRATLFVLSSFYEGMPNVLLEAMACGAPVISTSCPTGPSEILDPISTSDTLLTPPLTTQEAKDKMSEQIIKQLKNPPLRKENQKHLMNRIQTYEIKHVAQQWWDFFKKNQG